jgi:hypothetical protein
VFNKSVAQMRTGLEQLKNSSGLQGVKKDLQQTEQALNNLTIEEV